MEVYKRPGSPFWYVDIADPRAPGGRRRRSTKRKTKGEARLVADAAARQVLDREQLGALEELTLQEAVNRYVRSVERKADYQNIVGRTRKLLGQLGGRWHLDPAMAFHELTTRHLNTLRQERTREGNAPQTINHEVKVLSATYHLMQAEGVRVPAAIKFPVVKVAGKLRWFTPAEVDRLLRELDPTKVFIGSLGKMRGVRLTLSPLAVRQRQDAYDLVVMLLDTGCRYSEVGMIPWSAIDTVTWRWIDIYRTKTDNAGLLSMTDRLREALQRRYSARGNSAYVFPGYDADGDDTPRGVSTKAIRRAIDRAGLNAPELVKRYGRATTHTLRDTFASWLVQSGVSLFKVQKMLGHADMRMTAKYGHLEQREVSDEVAGVLNGLAVTLRSRPTETSCP